MRPFVLILAAAASLPAAPPAGWQPAGPWGGSATSIAIDPSNPRHLLTGARGSLVFRSTDGGANWTRLPFPRHFLGAVSALVIHPGDSRRFIAALSLQGSAYGGIWHSEDSGAHWSQAAGLSGISADAIAVWPRDPERVVAGTRDGVWRSVDGARSFERISAPWNHELRGVTAVAFHPSNSDIIYAGTTHLPWKTTDGGKTWKSIHSGMLDDSDVFSIYVDPDSPDRVFASACSGIYRSESSGDSWTRFGGIPGTHRRTHVIRLHPRDRNTIYAGTTLGLLRSTDGGRTFQSLNSLHILSMAFDPANPDRFFLATERTGLFKTEDGGKSLTPLNTGFVHRRALDWSASQGVVYLNVVQDGSAGGIFISNDAGRKWVQASSAAKLEDNFLTFIASCPNNPNLVFAGSEARLLRSTNGSKLFLPLKLPAPLNALSCVSHPASGKPVVLAATRRGPFRSHDLGLTWQPIQLTRAAIQHNAQAFYTSPNAPSRLAVRTTQALYLSEDAGASWRALNVLFPVASMNDFALPGGPGTPLLAATPAGLFASTDNGKTWARRLGGLADGTVSSLAVRPGRVSEVFATQFGMLYASRDAGQTWTPVPGSTIAEATLRKLLFPVASSALLLGLTYDLGVFYLDVSSL
jgi:photosystem II stability/assembly factor-like uncharacterized protein